MESIAKFVRNLIDNMSGSPCEKWMVCLYAFGCKDRAPHPMLCKWRFGKPWGYDFFALSGPFDSEEEAAQVCRECEEVTA